MIVGIWRVGRARAISWVSRLISCEVSGIVTSGVRRYLPPSLGVDGAFSTTTDTSQSGVLSVVVSKGSILTQTFTFELQQRLTFANLSDTAGMVLTPCQSPVLAGEIVDVVRTARTGSNDLSGFRLNISVQSAPEQLLG